MKLFRCDHCQNLVYFENHTCLACGRTLAYLPEFAFVASLEPAGDATPAAVALWQTPAPPSRHRRFRLCANYTAHQVCNWAVDSEDPNPLCLSCRLTVAIPDLSIPGHREAWYKIEVAKRRLLHGLRTLGLPTAPKTSPEDSAGLAFAFLADPVDSSAPDAAPVLTGHVEGLITLNLAEADDAERERRRARFHEPYRTLLGHLRHESGHYYWERLVRDHPTRLAACRALFGDDEQDYAAALQRHYSEGPRPDWQTRHISAYASAHPWEDWAETWAHYLHMADTLETADACGVRLAAPAGPDAPDTPVARDAFAATVARWFELTHTLNNLNRGLGQPDSYPFVLSEPVIEKLRFVHDTVAAASAARPAGPRRSPRASSTASATSHPANTTSSTATPAST